MFLAYTFAVGYGVFFFNKLTSKLAHEMTPNTRHDVHLDFIEPFKYPSDIAVTCIHEMQPWKQIQIKYRRVMTCPKF